MPRLGSVSRQFPSAGFLSRGLAAVTPLLLLLLLPLSLQCQDVASLRGTVRNAQDDPVAGATVQLQVKDTAPTQTVHTDLQGNYSFSTLRGGVYVLRAQMAG